MKRWMLVMLCAGLAIPALARAQFAAPADDQPDLTLDAATRRAVVDSLATAVERYYVFPDKGKAVAQTVRRRLATKQYDGITSAKAFSDSLTRHVQAVTHDLHLRVHYRHEPLPERRPNDDGPSPEERARQLRQEQVRNFGFEKVQRLAGNVGYLDLRAFSGAPEAQQTAVAAMQFLGSADALIVDLRRNGGGSPAMIATLLTYLVPEGDRLHFNDFFQRRPEGDAFEQWWTSPAVPGARLAGKPVYVLTSPRTGSAAEEFAYDIQTHKLGTLIGASTAGGAHPGGLFRLNSNFAAFIATGRAINPITKTNWEGVGVQPDVKAAPEEALKLAHVAALEKLKEKPRDDDHRAMLDRALEAARQTPNDSADEFVRRRGPRAAL